MTNLYFLPISGQDEKGTGCYALIINDDILIFDAGAKQLYKNTLGVKRILPDANWLTLNKHKIKGIFIGEPSALTTDGLLHLVTKINPNLPVYVTELGKMYIEANFNYEINKNLPNFSFNYRIIEPKEPIYLEKHKIIPFGVFSAIPMSVGFLIKDLDGDIVIVNNFIVNNDYSKLYNNSLSDLPTLTHNVKLLVTNVGNVTYSKGFTSPNYQVREFMFDTVNSAKGRVVVSIYDHELYYLYVLASVAKQSHRPFIVYSLTSVNVFVASIKLKLFNNMNLVTLPLSEMNNSDNAIIVIIARVGELFPMLMDIINEDDKKLTPKKDDIYVLCTSKIAGVEKLEADTIDAFTRSEILMTKIPKTTLPIKASIEDQKYLIKLLKPRHVVPTNGLYRNFVDYANGVHSTGIPADAIHFVYNGEVFDVNKPEAKMEKITITEKYVGNLAFNNEIDYPILYEREKMSTDGFANVITLFKIEKDKIILTKYELNLIGVVDKTFLESTKAKEIIDELNKKVANYFETLIASEYDNKELKNSIKKITEKYLEKQLNKKPLVLIILTQIK